VVVVAVVVSVATSRSKPQLEPLVLLPPDVKSEDKLRGMVRNGDPIVRSEDMSRKPRRASGIGASGRVKERPFVV